MNDDMNRRMFRVLIVDDNDHVRNVLRFGMMRLNRMCAADGYWLDVSVEEARDALEALIKLEQSDYDLLIVDHYMPVMTGEELVDRIRARHGTLQPPVVFVSASPDDARRAAERTTNTIAVAKPLRAATLCGAIAILCDLAPPLETAHERSAVRIAI